MISALKRNSRAPSEPLPLHDLTGNGPLPDATFIAVIPGEAAPLIPLDLPPKLVGQGRDRVARRQLRDAFGGGDGMIDIRPARLGARREAWTHVLVVDRDDRRDWLGHLGAAAGRCHAVLPDYLTLPAAPDLWVIRCDGGRVLARLGPEDGFAAEPGLATVLLTGAAKAPPRAVLRLGPPEPEIDAFLAQLDRPVCNARSELVEQGLPVPEVLEHGELSLDVARDPGAERAEMRRNLRRLGISAGLALIGFAAWVGATVIETGSLQDRGLAYRQNAERILRDVMIPSGPILDIRNQVNQRLERARSASEATETEARPLDVLRRAGAILAQHSLRVTRVSYQPGTGLVVDLQIADFAALDALVGDLRAAGTAARVAQSGTRDDADGVEAVLAMAVTTTGGRP